jgi:hypothetical protein
VALPALEHVDMKVLSKYGECGLNSFGLGLVGSYENGMNLQVP